MMPGGTDGAPEKPQYRLSSVCLVAHPEQRGGGPRRNGRARSRVKFTRRPASRPVPDSARSTAVASNTSKTARASVRAGQAGQGGALSVLGEYKYLIPLTKGKHAYV